MFYVVDCQSVVLMLNIEFLLLCVRNWTVGVRSINYYHLKLF
jgi:hypothetical protein